MKKLIGLAVSLGFYAFVIATQYISNGEIHWQSVILAYPLGLVIGFLLIRLPLFAKYYDVPNQGVIGQPIGSNVPSNQERKALYVLVNFAVSMPVGLILWLVFQRDVMALALLAGGSFVIWSFFFESP